MIAGRSYGSGRSGTSRWVENSQQQPSSGISGVPRSLSNSSHVSGNVRGFLSQPPWRSRSFMPPTADNVSPKDPLLRPENNCFVNVAIVRSKRRRSFFFFFSCFVLDASIAWVDGPWKNFHDRRKRRLNYLENYFALKFLIFLSKHIFSIRSIRGKN